MGEALRVAIAAYKKEKHSQREKKRIIRKDIDYAYIEKLLNSLETDTQKIGIRIIQANGTIIEINKHQRKEAPLRDPYYENIGGQL